jgi:hypothetical protein
MLFSRFTQSAAALALLTIGFAAPAHAQNNKQIISGTWYEDRARPSNIGGGTVKLTFTQTPSDQFLNITNVSCHITGTPDTVIDDIQLYAGTTSGANDLGRNYYISGSTPPETSSSTKFYSVVTNQVFFKLGPGRFPTLEIDLVSASNSFDTIANCTIVGNLTDN